MLREPGLIHFAWLGGFGIAADTFPIQPHSYTSELFLS